MKNNIDKIDLIEIYYNWFNTECSNPFDELEWLINCALNGNDKDNINEVLNDIYKHYKQ
jgi:hypothetical protein